MTDEENSPPPAAAPAAPADLARTHLRFGWWAICIFVTLGLVLEALNGFKAGWYLDVMNEARRTTLRLAHAHGTLFGIVNILFAVSLPHLPGLDDRGRRLASGMLRGATVLLPGGFLVGGAVVYAGDPGLGVGLVPVGAALMIAATFLVARSARDA
jgi:ABC-type dipeptide/oligopeptide/nickel transport system permease subunit